MKPSLTVGFTACWLAVTLGGCSGPAPTTTPAATPTSEATPPPPTASPSPSSRPMGSPPPGHIPPQEDLVVDQVAADLAARLEIASSAVEVIEVESVTWSDAGLGCPVPGKMYAQVETPGWRIALRGQGDTYTYHADERGNFVLCQDDEPLEPVIQQEGYMWNKLVQEAVADLASRLDVAPRDIELVSFEEVTWRDGSLGCPQPGRAYTQALVEGTRTVLRAQGQEWDYHSGGTRGPFLCSDPEEPLPGDGGGSGDVVE